MSFQKNLNRLKNSNELTISAVLSVLWESTIITSENDDNFSKQRGKLRSSFFTGITTDIGILFIGFNFSIF